MDGSIEDCEAVAAKISNVIRSIDPVALSADSFWGTFVDDVAIGDYATEDVVEDRIGT